MDASLFLPDPSQRSRGAPGCITVVALSRLVYRKGIDLLAAVLPELCGRHPNLRFLIGGDGPKRCLLEQVGRWGCALPSCGSSAELPAAHVLPAAGPAELVGWLRWWASEAGPVCKTFLRHAVALLALPSMPSCQPALTSSCSGDRG